jgi:type IV pilus assembly protein PilM
MPEKILGLDIGDSSLKAVQVTGGLRGYHVSACARVEMGQEEGLENALTALSEKIVLDEGICIASIQADRVSFRNLSMPFKDTKKIGQTINYELEPMLPFSVDAITTDYVVTEDSEKTRILSASVLQETLEQYLALLSAHNVDPDVVDISSVPAGLQLAKEDHEEPDILFIDIGSRVTSIVLPTKHAVVLVRSFHFGGHSITEAIAKSKKISYPEAEALKCGDDADAITDIVRPLVESFCQETQNTLHAFRCETMEQANPEKVFLTGGGALCSQMATMFQDFLELPVELIDLAQRNGLKMEGDASEDWDPLVMNSALALALRDVKGKDSFNFRVGKFSKKKRYDQFRGEIKRIGIYAGVILLAIVTNLSADYYVMKKRHNHLQGEIASVFKKTFPDVERIVDPVHQMNVKIREAKESMLLPSESIVQRAVVDVLRDIALRIPKTVELDVSSLIIDEERVRLKGHTDTFNTVDAIKSGLEQSSYFKDVSIGSAQLDRTSNSVRFELVMGQK